MKYTFFFSFLFLNFSLSLAQQSGPFPLMVYFKSEPDLRSVHLVTNRNSKIKMMYQMLVQTTVQTQSAIWSQLTQRNFSFQSFYINNSLLISNADTNLAIELQRSPLVRKISYNTAFRIKPPQLRLVSRKENLKVGDNLKRIHADQVWSMNIAGQGIVVGSNDSGVQWNHPALVRQYRGFRANQVVHHYSWHDSIKKRLHPTLSSKCGYDLQSPCDDTGHGTHTIGTVLGSDGKAFVTGVAPSAQWIACRNMDNGVGTVATYLECFEFFFSPYPLGGNPMKDGRPELAPHIINNSWGCSKAEGCTGDEMYVALKNFYRAGIAVVASAGNSGPDCGSIDTPPPVNSEFTISVGSVDSRNEISVFSSRGPSIFDKQIGPDFVAPGEYIVSSLPESTYMERSGTSMAAPHVSGVIALLWSANKNLIGHLPETMSLLQRSSHPLTSSETCNGVSGNSLPNNTFGYGLIDALAAIRLLSGAH